jgi:GR25 family glycosyltransferase involved in LPS biosynthesis
MKTICIALTDLSYGDKGPRTTRGFEAREAVGVRADVFWGIHAMQLGLKSDRLYMLDGPPGSYLAPKIVGCWLSHRALWAACLLLPENEFLLLEDDASFPVNWAQRTHQALRDVPKDWDFINIGPCCAMDKPMEHVNGEIYVAPGAMCLHAYYVTRKGLITLIKTQDAIGCGEPIDISVSRHSLPHMKAYVVLPRIVDQLDMPDLVR